MFIESFKLGKVLANSFVEFSYPLVADVKNIDLSCSCLSVSVNERSLEIKWKVKSKGKKYISNRYVIITYADDNQVKVLLNVEVYE